MKVKEIQQFLQQENIDVAFITTPENVNYITGFNSDPHERLLGVAVFKEAAPFIICPQMEVPDAKRASGWEDVVGHLDTQNAMDILADAIRARVSDVKSIAIEKLHLNVARYEQLQERFVKASFPRLDDKLNYMRVIKSEDELVKLREAAKLADFAVQVGCDNIAEGKTELDVLNAIETAVKNKGYDMSFSTMVLTGKNSASPHGVPGHNKIQKGDFVLFDLGVLYEGYCSDITRTVSFGEPTDKQIEIYETVLKANESAIAAVKPTVKAKDIDKVARDIITNAGFGDYFPHRLGHGLGISVHEFPDISSVNEMALEENMVFTIEPGIYKGDVTGVRIEDDVVVTKDGVEVLTKFPKQLTILPVK
ncbi:dipeptidase [Lysinibacillus alkalisoli]|uniref:Dipeptidase n=1 Tax=Lysinibacillus alkalisoli TaxID=1911548 RepID=A0A917G9H4_9BACI|nr:Xaa-Pro peptidase family protein [Lysinibacillus alkalisoli]GGG29855.1 dipeptidase [Lysinibacillus alkalisoli]